MSCTDGDEQWTSSQGDCAIDLSCDGIAVPVKGVIRVAGFRGECDQLPAVDELTEVVLDSGADESCLPYAFAHVGCKASTNQRANFSDAQGNPLKAYGWRYAQVVLDNGVTFRERFLVTDVTSPLLACGKLYKAGWSVLHENNEIVLAKGSRKVPVRFRHNSLVVDGCIRVVTSKPPESVVRAVSLNPVLEGMVSSGSEFFEELIPGVQGLKCESNAYLDVTLYLPMEGMQYRTTLVCIDPVMRIWELWELCRDITTLDVLDEQFDDGIERTVLTIASREALTAEQLGIVVQGDVPEVPDVAMSAPAQASGEGEVASDAQQAAQGGIGSPPFESTVPGTPDLEALFASDVENEKQHHDGANVPVDQQVALEAATRDDDMSGDFIEVNGVRVTAESALSVMRKACEYLNIGRSGGKVKVYKRLCDHLKRLELAEGVRQKQELAQAESREPREVPLVKEPTLHERLQHNLTHAPYREWCQHCVMHKARSDRASATAEPKRAVSILSFDFGFTGRDLDPENKLITLCVKDRATGWREAIPTKRKGGPESIKFLTSEVVRLCNVLGYNDVTIRCDPEPSCRTLQQEVQKARGRLGQRTRLEQSGEEEKASNGAAEEAVESTRQQTCVLLSAYEHNTGKQVSSLHPLHAWAARHGSWLLNRFIVARDQQTPFECTFQSPYTGKLVEFGECVMAMCRTAMTNKPVKGSAKWVRSMWLGKANASDGHLVVTAGGKLLITRSIRRTPERWDPTLHDCIKPLALATPPAHFVHGQGNPCAEGALAYSGALDRLRAAVGGSLGYNTSGTMCELREESAVSDEPILGCGESGCSCVATSTGKGDRLLVSESAGDVENGSELQAASTRTPSTARSTRVTSCNVGGRGRALERDGHCGRRVRWRRGSQSRLCGDRAGCFIVDASAELCCRTKSCHWQSERALVAHVPPPNLKLLCLLRCAMALEGPTLQDATPIQPLRAVLLLLVVGLFRKGRGNPLVMRSWRATPRLSLRIEPSAVLLRPVVKCFRKEREYPLVLRSWWAFLLLLLPMAFRAVLALLEVIFNFVCCDCKTAPGCRANGAGALRQDLAEDKELPLAVTLGTCVACATPEPQAAVPLPLRHGGPTASGCDCGAGAGATLARRAPLGLPRDSCAAMVVPSVGASSSTSTLAAGLAADDSAFGGEADSARPGGPSWSSATPAKVGLRPGSRATASTTSTCCAACSTAAFTTADQGNDDVDLRDCGFNGVFYQFEASLKKWPEKEKLPCPGTGFPGCSFGLRLGKVFGSCGFDGVADLRALGVATLLLPRLPQPAVLRGPVQLAGSVVQRMCIPVKQLCHDWKNATRIGEASHPGPSPASGSAGLLDGLGLKDLIRDMVREAVKEALREAFGSGLGAAFASATPSVPASAAAPAPPAAKGRENRGDKGKGKSEKGKGGPGKGDKGSSAQGGEAGQRPAKPNKPGKGRGAAPAPPKPDTDDGDWKVVKRKPAAQEEFVLRQQDWDAPLMLFSEVAKAIDDTPPTVTFKAVVRCGVDQRAVLSRLLSGSKRDYCVLAVTLGREEDQKADTQRRVPGRSGDRLVFRPATVMKYISNAKGTAPQPKGMQQHAVKIEKKPTEVLVVRVSKTFASQQLWESFEKAPQRGVVQWLADRHVHPLDSFAWKAEQGSETGHQLYGLVRLLKPEAEAILHASGQDRVFLDPSRSLAIRSRINWVERTSKQEAHGEYLARAVKCAGDLGLVVKGNRIATRHTLTSGDRVAKIWMFEHVPMSVDTEQAKSILETTFQDIVMMRVRGTKGERTFYFKGSHATDPDADLAPINLDTGEGLITTWARVAPPRAERVKQRQLPAVAVPLETKQTYRGGTPIAVPTEASDAATEGNEEASTAKDGEPGNASEVKSHERPTGEEPKAKKLAVSPELRAIPAGMRLEEQPKDGACAFHCFSVGLHKLSKGKIDKHPRLLRAEAVEHMTKHSEDYQASWDKKDPTGAPMEDWSAYLTAVSAESSYVSDLELRALARLYDTRVVLIPAMACFPPVVFHAGQRSPKRRLVLWYKDRHLDLLVPEEGKKVSEDVGSITASINYELRVGGHPRSHASAASSSAGSWGGPGTVFTSSSSSSWSTPAGTVWTQGAGASGAGPTQATLGSAAADDCFEEEAGQDSVATKAKPKPKFYWQGHGVKKLRVFRCELCAYSVAVSSPSDLCNKRWLHCTRYHQGEGLPGRKSRSIDYIGPIKRGAKVAWRCPLCPHGLAEAIRSGLSASAITKAKRRHRDLHHSEIPLSKWHRLCRPRVGSEIALERTELWCRKRPEKHGMQEAALNSLFEAARGQDFGAEAFSLQELDLTPLEVPRYVHAWRQAGYQPFPLQGSLAATRVAAGLVQVQSGGRARPLILAAMYGFPDDRKATEQVVQQFLDEVRPWRCMFVLFGDFNWQRGEGGLVDDLFSSGQLRCLDDSFDGHPLVATTRVDHEDGPADHMAVRYTLDFDLNFQGHRLPARAPFVTDRSVEDIEASFKAAWVERDFTDCLQDGRLDDAWGVLSGAAEVALGAERGSGDPRAFEPVPEPCEDRRRSLRAPKASRGLAGLRRLQRRLKQLELEPEDANLRRCVKASLSGLRELVPQLPYFAGDLSEAGAVVEQLVQELHTQEVQASVEAWQATEKSFAHSCAWIKRKADQARACFQEPKELRAAVATHPTSILASQGAQWSSTWTRPTGRAFPDEAFRKILADIPRPEQQDIALCVSGDALHKATKKMIKRSGGADDWQACDLLRLPMGFWEATAKLWNHALEHGQLPSSWTNALVVLIPKPDGRTRPIGLMSLLWRAGARVLVRQLRAWSSSWATAQAMGGMAGVGVSDAHVQGFTSQAFAKVDTGVVQGCPLSPLLSLLVGQAWATYAVGHLSSITAMVYIDDRVLWPTAWQPNAEADMRTALGRSDFFDQALELQCKPEKCALAHDPEDSSMVALAAARGYQCQSVLEFLGIRFDLVSQECTPLKLDLGKLKWRIRYIQRLGAPLPVLQQLVSSLVGAALYWAGGVAQPREEDLRCIADELYHLFQANFLRDTPRLLLHELLGWRTEPHFACDLAAFRAVARYMTGALAWRDHVPLAEAFDGWRQVLPLAAQAADRFGWQVLQGGKQLMRYDDLDRQRFYHFGFDSFQVLEDWLCIEYRRMFLNRCGRVRQRLHRDGNFASGLDLPAPGTIDLRFEGHRKVFHQAPNLTARRAAAGTGCSVWYWTAGMKLNPGDARTVCLCGAQQPSRAHLTWSCPKTAHLRQGLAMPKNRSEERLMAKALPQWPPAPVSLDEEDFVEQLAADAMSAALEAEALSGGAFDFQDFEGDFPDRWMIAATDGSACDGVAAYSVVFPGGRGGGSGDSSEDQTPFRAELKALVILFKALLSRPLGVRATHACRFLLRRLPGSDARQAMGRRLSGSLRSRWKPLAEEAEAWERNALYASAHASDVYHSTFGQVLRTTCLASGCGQDCDGLERCGGFSVATVAMAALRACGAGVGNTLALRAPLGLPCDLCAAMVASSAAARAYDSLDFHALLLLVCCDGSSFTGDLDVSVDFRDFRFNGGFYQLGTWSLALLFLVYRGGYYMGELGNDYLDLRDFGYNGVFYQWGRLVGQVSGLCDFGGVAIFRLWTEETAIFCLTGSIGYDGDFYQWGQLGLVSGFCDCGGVANLRLWSAASSTTSTCCALCTTATSTTEDLGFDYVDLRDFGYNGDLHQLGLLLGTVLGSGSFDGAAGLSVVRSAALSAISTCCSVGASAGAAWTTTSGTSGTLPSSAASSCEGCSRAESTFPDTADGCDAAATTPCTFCSFSFGELLECCWLRRWPARRLISYDELC
ncbi:Ptchd3 [Symbiodinium sp. CCMP2592]|nr:Ptchd3 [Symbiodinium sp. CCMP2592]